MKLSLVVLTAGKMEGKSIPVTQKQFLIGRDAKCQLRPASALISNLHCTLQVRGRQVFVQDLKSTNGTFVNGNRIDGEMELHDTDRLKVGPLEFNVSLELPAAVDNPTPPPKTRVATPQLDDDMAASLLLSGDGEGTPPSSSLAATDQEIPVGSTLMDTSLNMPAAAEDPAKDKAALSKLEQIKKEQADTSVAASAILEKYMRRR